MTFTARFLYLEIRQDSFFFKKNGLSHNWLALSFHFAQHISAFAESASQSYSIPTSSGDSLLFLPVIPTVDNHHVSNNAWTKKHS